MKKHLLYLIPVCTYSLAILIFSIIQWMHKKLSVTSYIILFCVPLVVFLFPLYKKLRKEEPPIILVFLSCIHISFAVYGGNALNLYEHIWFYDLFLHGFFGFLCSLFLYYVFMKAGIKEISPIILLILILLATLGIGAIWELWEYTCDVLTGGDTLQIEESILKGALPVADTMEDLFITIVGVCFFYIYYGIDKWTHFKVLGSLRKENKNS